MSPLRKEMEKHLKEMCQEMGFRKSKYMYYKPINDDFIANIMFPSASYQIKYHILVACGVGVSSIKIARIFEECAELPKAKVHDNVILTNIGYLTPAYKYKEWDYSEKSDPQIIFRDIQEHIERYAYPFYDKYSDIDNLTEAIYEGTFHCTIDRNILLSIIFYLHGDSAMAMNYLDKLVRIRQQSGRGFGSILEERFEQNFRKLLSGGQKLE